jgi:hypothetical protein
LPTKHPTFDVKYELWIEKDALLLRKLRSMDESSSSEQTRTNIHINESIETTLFAAELRDQAA